MCARSRAGGALAWGLGPDWFVSREVEIPLGSMSVPDEQVEVLCVIDRRSDQERVGFGVAFVLGVVALGNGVAGLTQL